MANENSMTPTATNIPLEKIRDLPGMEKEKRPDKEYGSMVSSILIHGVKEPVILRPLENGEYQLVAGYKRRRAAELAKRKELPALIYDMSEKEALDYRAKAAKDPNTPIPGKPVGEKAAEEKKEEKPAAAPAEKTAEKKEPKAPETKAEAEPAKPAEAPAAPTADKKEQKAAAGKAEPAKSEEAPAAPATTDKEKKPAVKESKAKAPAAKKAEKKEEAPVGTEAVGPTGTTITKILESKLSPPTAKDRKSLPVPGEGEAFSVILYP